MFWNFEKYFNSLSTTEEKRMISEENTGIDAKDRDFSKMKSDNYLICSSVFCRIPFKTLLICKAT